MFRFTCFFTAHGQFQAFSKSKSIIRKNSPDVISVCLHLNSLLRDYLEFVCKSFSLSYVSTVFFNWNLFPKAMSNKIILNKINDLVFVFPGNFSTDGMQYISLLIKTFSIRYKNSWHYTILNCLSSIQVHIQAQLTN